MSSRPTARRLLAMAHLTLIGLAGVTGAVAQTRTSGATLFVTVLADRYLSEGVVFPDLDSLAKLVEPVRPTWLVLQHCAGAASGPLLSAAERFRDSPLRIVLADDPRCSDAVRNDSVLLAQAGSALPLRATAAPDLRYWNQVMP